MTKNPLLNAAAAAGYIGLIVYLLDLLSRTQGSKPDTVFAPVVFLSLLTLSVTVMALVFFYQPLQLLIAGKKKEALDLFAKTVGIFAIVTIILVILMLTGTI